ncbi:MAG: D-amino acid aminotransferase [Rhodospirillales bacterium RIFCSPLOWO2_12_FULL_58_28]|nr:MAG: D-amino acid aminotransferase [Rhodospirillales bacterium RIFCSPLOWO2_12_FULL_58_28]
MSVIAYVNGHYVPHHEAAVHVEDRGYQFADGVYEVIAICAGRMIEGEAHLDRLDRSLGELAIEQPMGRRALKVVIGEMIRRNRLRHGFIYLQVTRGVARRDHAFPDNATASLVMTARRGKPFDSSAKAQGVSVITTPDIRWKRCDIKSISLLPNVLGKQKARASGAFEAWLVDDKGCITEGTSSNAWIVTAKGELVTRHIDHAILSGITRAMVLDLAQEESLALVERPFSVDEAKTAVEAFLSNTTSFIKPVTHIDGEAVGKGRPGPLCSKLMDLYAARLIDYGSGI